jgi:hypothetical protein
MECYDGENVKDLKQWISERFSWPPGTNIRLSAGNRVLDDDELTKDLPSSFITAYHVRPDPPGPTERSVSLPTKRPSLTKSLDHLRKFSPKNKVRLVFE